MFTIGRPAVTPSMRRLALSLPLLPVLVACGSNEIVSSLASPSSQYHVEVRRCQQNGAWFGTQKLQVSVLPQGVSEPCQSAVHALAQFDGFADVDALQLEWLSDTELRAWQPGFDPAYGPSRATYQAGKPVTLTFRPK
ncbi:hypothetical protein [Verticiella alkaliphila]|uniref:hypothetical protein n=1 Tax=Verticiella alkaliphila TaxID=2779529 RepID=UPI00209BB4F1|nr:hypothetical protein [Verticiella sp. GG226]